MTDPAIAYAPNENYSTFDRGSEADVWLKAENGSYLLGVVWPGTSLAPFLPKWGFFDISCRSV